MRTRRSLLALPFLVAAGCGDNLPEPGASLAGADPALLGRAIDSASGAEARAAIDLARALPRDGSYEGTVLVEEVPLASASMTRVTFEGFRDAERTIDGVIELVGSASLVAELEVTIDEVTIATTLALACGGNDLCEVARDSWVSIGELGDATIRGAWRQDPRGGYLTLVGAESLTFDFNAPVATGCVPYTVDGEPGGELCDAPIVP
jgi:hypothetical protein